MIRPSLILATLVSLLLMVSGAAAPAGLAAKATSTRVAGIDVDATTIPQLQAAHGSPPAVVGPARPVLPPSDQEAEPEAQRGHHGEPDAPSPTHAPRTGPAARATTSPLLGIPVIVKDNVNTDRHADDGRLVGARGQHARRTRSSSSGCAPPARSSSRKANLSEWANFRSAPSSSGWSGIGGQTNMAHVLDRNPCGSSSGIGRRRLGRPRDRRHRHRDRRLDRLPVGRERHRRDQADARARLSRAGVIPISADQDTAGPMTRNVTDAAVVLGRDHRHRPAPTRRPRPRPGTPSTTTPQFLDADALDGARIGVWREGTYDPAISPEVDAIINDVGRALEAPARRSSTRRGSRSSTPTAPSSRRSSASSRTTSPATSRRTPPPAIRRRSRT